MIVDARAGAGEDARAITACAGEPLEVMRPKLPDAASLLPYLQRIDAARVYTNWGPLATELETRLSTELGVDAGRVVSASSGTAALVGAILAAAGRPQGRRDIAVVPAFTFVATALAVEQAGYRPLLADIDAATWMLDPERLAAEVARDRVGLVVPVGPFGLPVAQEPWLRFREQTGIPVVIDGAASFERLAGGDVGGVGEIAVALSFHATKSFSTAEGGSVVSTDPALCHAVTRCLNFGFYEERTTTAPSINGKLSEYHAAIGLAELDGWASKRSALRAVADGYRRLLAPVGLADRVVAAPDIGSTCVLFRAADGDESARVQAALGVARIGYRLWYGHGLHRHSHFAPAARGALSVTEDLAPRLIGLPAFADMADDAIARVVDTVAAAVR